MILMMKMLLEKNIYAHQNLVRFFYLPDTRRYWMLKYGQPWLDQLCRSNLPEVFCKNNVFLEIS